MSIVNELKKTQEIKKTVRYHQNEKNLGYVVKSFVIGTNASQMDRIISFFLTLLLIDGEYSFIRKSLIESGFGSELFGGDQENGFWDPQENLLIHIGLKNVKTENFDTVAGLIDDLLIQSSKNKFTDLEIESVFSIIEMTYRQMKWMMPGQPMGINFISRILISTNYGHSAPAPLEFQTQLNLLRGQITGDPNFIKNLIEIKLINCNQKFHLEVYPDPEFDTKLKGIETENLELIQKNLKPKEIENLKFKNAELETWQSKPDDIDILNRLPALKSADLIEKKRIKPVVYKI